MARRVGSSWLFFGGGDKLVRDFVGGGGMPHMKRSVMHMIAR